MLVVAVYSEKGGVGKTTSTLGLAAAAAAKGNRVGVVDLDPQFAATTWLDAQPEEDWKHVGAILADEDPRGWSADLARPAGWAKGSLDIQVIPSARAVALREQTPGDQVEGRLKSSFDGWERDVIFIDVPNRQGGPLVANALTAADVVVVPVPLNEDGLEGLDRAQVNVERFARTPWNPSIRLAGVVVVGQRTILTKDNRRAANELAVNAGIPILASVPDRTAVPESRSALDWWGNYKAKGSVEVAAAYDKAYDALAAQLVASK